MQGSSVNGISAGKGFSPVVSDSHNLEGISTCVDLTAADDFVISIQKDVYKRQVEEYTIDAYGAFRTKVYAQDDVAARAYFATAKAATISKFNAVDLSVYSTTSKSTKTGYTDKTYYELAKAHIDGVLNTINGYVIAADAKDAAVKAQIDNLNTKVTENLDEIKDTTGKVTGYKLNATVKEKYGLKTITEEQGEALTLEAKKKTLISQMNAEILSLIHI